MVVAFQRLTLAAACIRVVYFGVPNFVLKSQEEPKDIHEVSAVRLLALCFCAAVRHAQLGTACGSGSLRNGGFSSSGWACTRQETRPWSACTAW